MSFRDVIKILSEKLLGALSTIEGPVTKIITGMVTRNDNPAGTGDIAGT